LVLAGHYLTLFLDRLGCNSGHDLKDRSLVGSDTHPHAPLVTAAKEVRRTFTYRNDGLFFRAFEVRQLQAISIDGIATVFKIEIKLRHVLQMGSIAKAFLISYDASKHTKNLALFVPNRDRSLGLLGRLFG
jgi:hypothetical protein